MSNVGPNWPVMEWEEQTEHKRVGGEKGGGRVCFYF